MRLSITYIFTISRYLLINKSSFNQNQYILTCLGRSPVSITILCNSFFSSPGRTSCCLWLLSLDQMLMRNIYQNYMESANLALIQSRTCKNYYRNVSVHLLHSLCFVFFILRFPQPSRLTASSSFPFLSAILVATLNQPLRDCYNFQCPKIRSKYRISQLFF